MLLRVFGCRPDRHLAKLATATILIIGRATQDTPTMPFSLDQLPPELFELLEDAFYFLRRVPLSRQNIYSAILNCQLTS